MKNQKEQTEFYSPFAHIPGKYEWCRIHSPSQEKDFPVESAYGGSDFAVWGSHWRCSGVDLELKSSVEGRVLTTDGEVPLDSVEGVVTLGSYGRIESL